MATDVKKAAAQGLAGIYAVKASSAQLWDEDHKALDAAIKVLQRIEGSL